LKSGNHSVSRRAADEHSISRASRFALGSGLFSQRPAHHAGRQDGPVLRRSGPARYCKPDACCGNRNNHALAVAVFRLPNRGNYHAGRDSQSRYFFAVLAVFLTRVGLGGIAALSAALGRASTNKECKRFSTISIAVSIFPEEGLHVATGAILNHALPAM
jgi:hypothetical protein